MNNIIAMGVKLGKCFVIGIGFLLMLVLQVAKILLLVCSLIMKLFLAFVRAGTP